MKLKTKAFNKIRELNDFTNEQGIEKEDIINIFQSNDGLFILSYYEEEDKL